MEIIDIDTYFFLRNDMILFLAETGWAGLGVSTSLQYNRAALYDAEDSGGAP